MHNTKLFSTRNSLSAKVRMQMIELLNRLLADGMDLYSQTKQAHWNLKGMQFMQVHLLLDKLAEELLKHLDDIAERATALGGVARGTVRMAAESSQLEEYPIDNFSVEDHVKTLADHYGKYANHLRYAIKQADDAEDAGTADLFTQCIRDADKALWFLEAHLETAEKSDDSESAESNGASQTKSKSGSRVNGHRKRLANH